MEELKARSARSFSTGWTRSSVQTPDPGEPHRHHRHLLRGLRSRLADKTLKLEITDAAKELIIDRGYDPVYGARPLKRYLQSRVETSLGYCRKIIFRVRRVLHVVCAVFIHHAQAVWRNAHHRVCRRRRIIPQTFLLFCHSIAAFHSYYARGSDLQPPKSVVYCKNLFFREAVQMDKKRDYIEFIGSMLIFGTNGLLVTNIPLSSAQIVLTRTFFGSIFFCAWCWPDVSFR
jgi:hypothetical protein